MPEIWRHAGALIIGTTAERGAFDTSVLRHGNLWFDTDLSAFLVWEGSAWTHRFADVLEVGDGTNYTEIDATGDVSFTGTARIDWAKITADNVTLNNGVSADTVADLRTLGDGNFYSIQEVAGAPGIDLEVEFINVDAFHWVQITGCYDGAANHAVAVQLYNFDTTTWDTFGSAQNAQEDITNPGEYILCSYSFFVGDDTNYVGTAGDAGDVRVRFHHTMGGNNAHDLYLDVVALYH